MTTGDNRVGETQIATAFELYEKEDPSAAAALEAVLVADPAHVAARYKLANVQKAAGELVQAQANYERVLEQSPSHAEALNNLGAVRQLRGDAVAAQAYYRRSIKCAPELVAPALNLARLLQELGRGAEAQRVCAEAEIRGLDSGLFGHLRLALGGSGQGAPAGRAPNTYVRETFDAFAADFEQRLVLELGYEVPRRLVELARSGGANLPRDVLDLGCGTGLVADALAGAFGSHVMHLTGIDLSPRMLEEAGRKDRYAVLHEGDVTGWLMSAAGSTFDLVLAADVFIYIGELDTVFSEVARVLRAGGRFAFSIETCSDRDWELRQSGRYAQSGDYIQALARRSGLSVRVVEAVTVRRGVQGSLFVLSNP